MIRLLLVDDEAPARKRMRRLLEAYPEIEICGEAEDGLKALEKISELSPDAVFLDIEMPELNGFGVTEALRENPPAIVFVTAYDEFAIRAFEASAIDYLLKPVSEARLRITVEKLKRRQAPPQNLAKMVSERKFGNPVQKLAIRSGSRFVIFDPKQIYAIVARDHYAGILVEGRELLADDSLDQLEARLSGDNFVRIHRGSIINIEFLQELTREGDRKYTAVLSDSARTKLAVSRERLDYLKERLGVE